MSHLRSEPPNCARSLRSIFRGCYQWTLPFLGVWCLSIPAPLPAQDEREPAAAAGRSEDAFLVGLIGGAHVAILHDYLGLLAEQVERKGAPDEVEGTLRRLDFVSSHCTELISRIESRAGEERVAAENPVDELTGLLSLVRNNARALHRRIDRPSRETIIEFQKARSELKHRIEQLLGAPEEDEDAGDG